MGLRVLGPDVNESREMFTPVFRGMTIDQGPMTNEKIRADSASLDISHSSLDIPPRSGGAIRFGLAGIKGVGELAAQKIIAEREANGPFSDFENFASRVDARALNKRVLEHLVKTGAFDFSGASRKKLFDGIDAALSAASSAARDKAAGQHSFLDMLAEEPPKNGAAAPRGLRSLGEEGSPRGSSLNPQLSALNSQLRIAAKPRFVSASPA